MRRFRMKNLCRVFVLAPLAVGVAAPVASAALNFPPMRSGFWVSNMLMHMSAPGQPPDKDGTPRVSYNCQDADSMAASLKLMSGTMKGCVFGMEGGGAVYTMTTNCKNPEGLVGTINGTGKVTLQGDSAMHIDETSVSNLANMPMTMTMSVDSRWTGACPAGAVPGDYGTMENGVFKKDGNSLTHQ